MAKTLTAAAVMALVNSKKSDRKIQYPGDVDIDLIRVPNMDYQMVFKWPTNQTGGSRCTATMIRPDVALTAAHCLSSSEDGVNPGLDAQLADGSVYTIRETRINECWDTTWQGPFSDDIALLFFDTPIPDAVQGVHYVTTWDAATMGDVVGREFILAGWGRSGAVQDDGSDADFTSGMQYFHRGYNVFNEIRDNVLVYTLDRPEDGGLELEVAGYYGDSGSGGFVDDDGELKIVGVLSHGQGAFWGAEHGYTRVGGYHTEWIDANVASPNERVATTHECDAGYDDIYETCEDTNIDASGNPTADVDGDACDGYARNPRWCGGYDDEDFNSGEMCCACGGGREIEDGGDEGGDEGGEEGGDEGDDEGDAEVCEDTNIDTNGNPTADRDGDDCEDYARNPSWCGGYDDEDFTSN